jgi:hypothetical protein
MYYGDGIHDYGLRNHDDFTMEIEVGQLIKKLEEKNLEPEDVMRMGIRKWYQSPSLITEVIYEYDDDKVIVTQRTPGESLVFNQQIAIIFRFKPDPELYKNFNMVDLEDACSYYYDQDEIDKIQELKAKGLDNIKILEELGKDPADCVADLFIEAIESSIGLFGFGPNWWEYFDNFLGTLAVIHNSFGGMNAINIGNGAMRTPEIDRTIKSLKEKGITIYDVVKMAVEKWYQSPSLFTEVLYMYFDDKLLVAQRQQGETFVYNQEVISILRLEPNWIDDKQLDLEKYFSNAGEEDKARKARDLLNEGKSKIEVLKELGEDPVEYLTRWIIEDLKAEGVSDWETYFAK